MRALRDGVTDAMVPVARAALERTVGDPDGIRHDIVALAEAWDAGELPITSARWQITAPAELFIAMGRSLSPAMRPQKLLLTRFAEALEALREGTPAEVYHTRFGTFTRAELDRAGARYELERDPATGRPLVDRETGELPPQLLVFPVATGASGQPIYLDQRNGSWLDPDERRALRWQWANSPRPTQPTAETRWQSAMER